MQFGRSSGVSVTWCTSILVQDASTSARALGCSGARWTMTTYASPRSSGSCRNRLRSAWTPPAELEVDARRQFDFDEDETAFLRNYANLLAAAIERMRWHDKLERDAREQLVLARELEHRVKNILSLVLALASQSVDDRSAQGFRDEFLGRLHALSRAESLVFEKRGETADLHRIAEDIHRPLAGGKQPPRHMLSRGAHEG